MPIGRSMVTVRRSFSPVAILQFAAELMRTSAFSDPGSLVVVLSPPNRPPNIARVDVVAAGLRALAWWTSMDEHAW